MGQPKGHQYKFIMTISGPKRSLRDAFRLNFKENDINTSNKT